MTEQEIEKIEKAWPTEAEFSSGKEFKGPSAEEAMRQVWKLTAALKETLQRHSVLESAWAQAKEEMRGYERALEFLTGHFAESFRGTLRMHLTDFREKCVALVRDATVYDNGQLTLTKAAEKIERL